MRFKMGKNPVKIETIEQAEEELRRAERAEDPDAVYRLVNAWGFDLDTSHARDLYGLGETNALVASQGIVERGEDGRIVVPKNWDIRRKDLGVLSYDDLRYAFYGMHNLGVPSEIFDLENPDEIIANYIGAAILKRGDRSKVVEPEGFLDLVGEINKAAYQGSLKRLRQGCNKRFPNQPGSLKTRLGQVPYQAVRRFADSFNRPYVLSSGESSSGEYHDPNIDGRSKDLYVRALWDHFQKKYSDSRRE
jgi:hypothetical protein